MLAYMPRSYFAPEPELGEYRPRHSKKELASSYNAIHPLFLDNTLRRASTVAAIKIKKINLLIKKHSILT